MNCWSKPKSPVFWASSTTTTKKKKKVDSADIYACVNYRLFQKFKLLGYGKLRVRLETVYLAEQNFFAKSTVDKAKK